MQLHCTFWKINGPAAAHIARERGRVASHKFCMYYYETVFNYFKKVSLQKKSICNLSQFCSHNLHNLIYIRDTLIGLYEGRFAFVPQSQDSLVIKKRRIHVSITKCIVVQSLLISLSAGSTLHKSNYERKNSSLQQQWQHLNWRSRVSRKLAKLIGFCMRFRIRLLPPPPLLVPPLVCQASGFLPAKKCTLHNDLWQKGDLTDLLFSSYIWSVLEKARPKVWYYLNLYT